jgi:hypothetical protein
MAALALLVMALLVTACSGSANAPLGTPPAGHQSPGNAVAGYIGNYMRGHDAAACGYVAPGLNAVCLLSLQMAGQLGKLSGSWSLGYSVTSGARAIVALEFLDQCLGGKGCVTNTNPNAGLPHAGLSFDAAYKQALTPSGLYYDADCVLIHGRWYVWISAS